MRTETLRTLAVLVLALMPGLLFAAAVSYPLQQSGANITNQASLQRGAQLFFNYCASCHSAHYMRYSRIAEDLGLSEEEVQKHLNFLRDSNNPAEPLRVGEVVRVAMTADDGAAWFGAPPPDLTLTARAKRGGADWIYTYLKSFYPDPTRPIGWNNALFPNVSMPHVLWELQGVQEPIYEQQTDASGATIEVIAGFNPIREGRLSAQEYDDAARDLAAFMEYLAEPAALQRKKYGIWVLLYLLIFAGAAYLLKNEYWKDVH